MIEMDLLNEPVEFCLGGWVVLLRRVSTIRRMAILQAVALAQLARQHAEFLAAESGSKGSPLPLGKKLLEAAKSLSVSPTDELIRRFFRAALVAPKMTDKEVREAFAMATTAEMLAVISFLRAEDERPIRMAPEYLNEVARRVAQEYGWTPDQIGVLTDAQLTELVPGLRESLARDQAETERNTLTVRAIAEWKKEHGDQPADYFNDILPIMNRLSEGKNDG